MSSILDALNKLEREKAQEAVRDIDPASAAKDIVGPDLFRDRMTLRVSPGVLVIGLLAFAVLLVAASVAVSMLFLRPAVQSASLVPEPVPAAPVVAAITVDVPAVEETTPEPAPDGVQAATDENAIAEEDIQDRTAVEEVVADLDMPPVVPAAEPEARIESVEETVTETVQADVARVEPTVEESEPLVSAARDDVSVKEPEVLLVAAAPQSEPMEPDATMLDLSKLPLWTPSVEQRYRVDRIIVNMVAPQALRQRMGKTADYAVINKSKVQVGQNVPGTPVQLVRVEADGVVIQIEGSRDYYFLPL